MHPTAVMDGRLFTARKVVVREEETLRVEVERVREGKGRQKGRRKCVLYFYCSPQLFLHLWKGKIGSGSNYRVKHVGLRCGFFLWKRGWG